MVNPTSEVLAQVIKELNNIDTIIATGEFINEIPRHNMVKIELPDNTNIDSIFNLGALCGSIDIL